MNQYTPDLYEKMNKEIKDVMLIVRNDGRGYVPFRTMSNWENQKGSWANRAFDSSAVRKGIVYRLGKTKANSKGFRSSYNVINRTAAGAIYETAGRVNPTGQPWVGRKGKGGNKYSHSSNPKAGQTFIANLTGNLVGGDKQKGRLIYRAWAEDNGKVLPAVVKSINDATTEFNKRAKP